MRPLAVTLGVVLLAAGIVRAQEDVQGRMKSWTAALGVECGHCHVPDQWSDSSRPSFLFAQRMSRMVGGLNAGVLRGLEGITCWTCHRGRSIPARLPRAAWEKVQSDHAVEFTGDADRALAMSVYAASLGVDCGHCHAENRADNTKPAWAMVTRMSAIFDDIPKYFEEARQPRTQCYMCHQGAVTPERRPR